MMQLLMKQAVPNGYRCLVLAYGYKIKLLKKKNSIKSGIFLTFAM